MVEGEDHVGRIAILDYFAIFVELEAEVGRVEAVKGDKLANCSGAIEAFSNFPGVTFFFAAGLEVAGSEVDAKGDFGVVAGGEFGLDMLAVAVDFEDDFAFVMEVFSEFGVVEWFIIDE